MQPAGFCRRLLYARVTMTTLPFFLLAVATVLVTPGPTNALLWSSAALVGLRRSLPLILGEIAGYLIAIGSLRLIGQPLIAAVPTFGLVLRLVLVGYLLLLSWQLWWVDPSIARLDKRAVTIGRVFLTTLLNPKALVFAFLIFPHTTGLTAADLPALAPYVVGFVVTVGIVATSWISFGAVLSRLDDAVMPKLMSRIAAVVLGVIATLIAGSAIATIV